ncbi:hypothetical protein HDU93_007689 [Gonapodya sp. JEL0774]|nr:hypothetical protein HDU93_007689 [Gonapodya sp. JEL0774]
MQNSVKNGLIAPKASKVATVVSVGGGRIAMKAGEAPSRVAKAPMNQFPLKAVPLVSAGPGIDAKAVRITRLVTPCGVVGGKTTAKLSSRIVQTKSKAVRGVTDKTTPTEVKKIDVSARNKEYKPKVDRGTRGTIGRSSIVEKPKKNPEVKVFERHASATKKIPGAKGMSTTKGTKIVPAKMAENTSSIKSTPRAAAKAVVTLQTSRRDVDGVKKTATTTCGTTKCYDKVLTRNQSVRLPHKAIFSDGPFGIKAKAPPVNREKRAVSTSKSVTSTKGSVVKASDVIVSVKHSSGLTRLPELTKVGSVGPTTLERPSSPRNPLTSASWMPMARSLAARLGVSHDAIAMLGRITLLAYSTVEGADGTLMEDRERPSVTDRTVGVSSTRSCVSFAEDSSSHDAPLVIVDWLLDEYNYDPAGRPPPAAPVVTPTHIGATTSENVNGDVVFEPNHFERQNVCDRLIATRDFGSFDTLVNLGGSDVDKDDSTVINDKSRAVATLDENEPDEKVSALSSATSVPILCSHHEEAVRDICSLSPSYCEYSDDESHDTSMQLTLRDDFFAMGDNFFLPIGCGSETSLNETLQGDWPLTVDTIENGSEISCHILEQLSESIEPEVHFANEDVAIESDPSNDRMSPSDMAFASLDVASTTCERTVLDLSASDIVYRLGPGGDGFHHPDLLHMMRSHDIEFVPSHSSFGVVFLKMKSKSTGERVSVLFKFTELQLRHAEVLGQYFGKTFRPVTQGLGLYEVDFTSSIIQKGQKYPSEVLFAALKTAGGIEGRFCKAISYSYIDRFDLSVFVMDQLGDWSLDSFLKSLPSNMSYAQMATKAAIMDVFESIESLHRPSNGSPALVHGDLKRANFTVSGEGVAVVDLAFMQDATATIAIGATPEYLAPEGLDVLFSGIKYELDLTALDMWALGKVVGEIYYPSIFEDLPSKSGDELREELMDIMEAWLNDEGNPLIVDISEAPVDDIRPIICWLTHPDPLRRASWDAVLSSSWWQDGVAQRNRLRAALRLAVKKMEH